MWMTNANVIKSKPSTVHSNLWRMKLIKTKAYMLYLNLQPTDQVPKHQLSSLNRLSDTLN